MLRLYDNNFQHFVLTCSFTVVRAVFNLDDQCSNSDRYTSRLRNILNFWVKFPLRLRGKGGKLAWGMRVFPRQTRGEATVNEYFQSGFTTSRHHMHPHKLGMVKFV